ncbi:5419_t:CDS:1, partial [Dentiscutata heterogama]
FSINSTLVQISLIIPVTNATVKSIFSRQNFIKTRLHNQMNTDTLNVHLMIVLNRLTIDLFNFEKAFEHWSLREHRI